MTQIDADVTTGYDLLRDDGHLREEQAKVASKESPFQDRPPRFSPSFSSVSICVYLWFSFSAYSAYSLS